MFQVARIALEHRFEIGERAFDERQHQAREALRHIEVVLRVLRMTGLRDRDAARAGYHLNNFVTEFAADEARFAAYASTPGSSRRKILTEARKQFASLSRTEYPTIVALADHLTEDAQDELFQFGIDMCLRGIQAMSHRRG
jgi:hypothetical protein